MAEDLSFWIYIAGGVTVIVTIVFVLIYTRALPLSKIKKLASEAPAQDETKIIFPPHLTWKFRNPITQAEYTIIGAWKRRINKVGLPVYSFMLDEEGKRLTPEEFTTDQLQADDWISLLGGESYTIVLNSDNAISKLRNQVVEKQIEVNIVKKSLAEQQKDTVTQMGRVGEQMRGVRQAVSIYQSPWQRDYQETYGRYGRMRPSREPEEREVGE